MAAQVPLVPNQMVGQNEAISRIIERTGSELRVYCLNFSILQGQQEAENKAYFIDSDTVFAYYAPYHPDTNGPA